MIKGKMIDNVFYTWEQIYKISGLVYEDWLYDSEGSYKHFSESLEKTQTFNWNEWYEDRDIYGNLS